MAFKQVYHNGIYLLPPSREDWLPEDHLARFVVDIVNKLDLSDIYKAYRGNGSDAYPPHVMVALLFYGYATGIFSSRKLERATYDSVASRYVAANTHPDHDTIANFRKRFLPELGAFFVQILLLANQMDVLRLGVVCLDGTKVKANASKHKALSYGHALKIEEQLREEVRRMLEAAEHADAEDLPDELSLPEELSRRDKRLAAIDKAKKELERRAAERAEEEGREYEEKMKKLHEQEQKTGRKPRGKGPTAPSSQGPKSKDQLNLTDEESRIMPVSGGGFEQCYNAQAAVDTKTMLIVGQHVTQHVNDKLELIPCLENLTLYPAQIGIVRQLIADNGYYSESNIRACEQKNVEAFLAVGREKHHPDVFERFSEPPALLPDADVATKMRHKLRTRAGRAVYALRKQVVEPVFGIIKEVMGFRRFMLRGLASVKNEWSLVCMAFNIKRIHKLVTFPKNEKTGHSSPPDTPVRRRYGLCRPICCFLLLAGWLFEHIIRDQCPTGS
jgi:transposase